MSDIRNIWGGTFEVNTDKRQSREGIFERPEEEVKQSWLLRAEEEEEEEEEENVWGGIARRRKKKKMGKFRKWLRNKSLMRTVLMVAVVSVFLAVVVLVAVKRVRLSHRHPLPVPDTYTLSLHKALLFFNAQKSGRLPKNNNVSWRGDSGLNDEFVGGYYDGGSATKFSFPASFAMTMLSWSAIEYGSKYEALGKLDDVKDVIKWGTDYLLRTFNSSAKSINNIVLQVGADQDLSCWMRPEDMDYTRRATKCYTCPAVAAEMAAALAAASIVFQEDEQYSKKLIHGADLLFEFATQGKGENYRGGKDPSTHFYNSTGFWDEFLWGGAWMFCATGNNSYLKLITSPDLTKNDRTFFTGPNRGVFNWNNKHAGAQLLLSRIRIYLGYGYPYEEMLRMYHTDVENIMCSYLPNFPNFQRTRGGLILLNRGRPQPLQHAANAAFLAALFSDYLEGKMIPGWQCGSQFYQIEALRDFARSQIDYILGKNPPGVSYVVGVGDHFPGRVHHRGASIPNDKVKYGCKDGVKWRDSKKPNPNIITGAMVAGPNQYDHFQDVRSNYNYTEPTIAGNAGLVTALVALSGGSDSKIDTNTIFYAIPPLHASNPPPPPPWIP